MNQKKYEELGEWVEKAKNGDETAFQYLYQYTYKKVRFLVYNFVDNKEEVEDIVQEVYINIYRSLPSLKDNKAFLGWVNQIATRCCIKTIDKKEESLLSIDGEIENITETLDIPEEQPIDLVLDDERNRLLLNCIEKLPRKQKMTLVMRIYSELRYKEIANAMECSEHSVKKNLRLAKQNLKGIIGELPKQERSLLTTRSVGGFTFIQALRIIVKGMVGEQSSNLLIHGYKIVAGVGIVAMCGTGVYVGTKLPKTEPVVYVQETNPIVEETQKKETETIIQETKEPETIPETVEETVEKSIPKLNSWTVENDQLVLSVEDENGIDFEQVYGITYSGEKIIPEGFDKDKGLIFFNANVDDFTLYLVNLQGVIDVWEMTKE